MSMNLPSWLLKKTNYTVYTLPPQKKKNKWLVDASWLVDLITKS
jgi:hypothetical protein